LQGIPELAQPTTAFGTGLRFKPILHSGNAAAPSEEAATVAAEIAAMVGSRTHAPASYSKAGVPQPSLSRNGTSTTSPKAVSERRLRSDQVPQNVR
jgi:hypothetical protein